MNPLVSVVTLNYKDAKLTIDCVKKAIDSFKIANISCEIIVVDNSSKETYETLKLTFASEQVKIVETSANLGFAKANNIGIKLAKGSYLLVLNNDAFFDATCIMCGIAYLREHQSTAIWAPMLVGMDGVPQRSVSSFPSLIDTFGEYILLRCGFLEEKPNINNGPQVVDAVVGAFWLMPVSVINQIGFFDEDYFFNVEDIDYCKRVHNTSLQVVYDSSCSALHIGGASQKHNQWFNNNLLHENRIRYYKKHRSVTTAALASLIITIGLYLRRLYCLIRR